MRQAGHRYTFDDLLSGNFSLPSDLFHRIGGFDSTLQCREDYELGARLIKAAAQFTFVANAKGYHRDEVTDLDRSLHRKRQEAKADIQIGYRHPDLIYKLRVSFFGETSFLDWILIHSIFLMPSISELAATGLRLLLNLFEQMRMRNSWQKLNDRLHGYWYLRGVVDELKTYKRLLSFLQSGYIANYENDEIELDLQQGLAIAEKQLDKKRPRSMRIRYGQNPVAYIPPQFGAERIRGVHLRPMLSENATWALLQVLLLEDIQQENFSFNQLPVSESQTFQHYYNH
jgi:hypothetical protein